MRSIFGNCGWAWRVRASDISVWAVESDIYCTVHSHSTPPNMGIGKLSQLNSHTRHTRSCVSSALHYNNSDTQYYSNSFEIKSYEIQKKRTRDTSNICSCRTRLRSRSLKPIVHLSSDIGFSFEYIRLLYAVDMEMTINGWTTLYRLIPVKRVIIYLWINGMTASDAAT